MWNAMDNVPYTGQCGREASDDASLAGVRVNDVRPDFFSIVESRE